jgi:hypothetical protein
MGLRGNVKGGDSAYSPSDKVNKLLPLYMKWKFYSHSVILLPLSSAKG